MDFRGDGEKLWGLFKIRWQSKKSIILAKDRRGSTISRLGV
jgi:hypothetical protein